MTTPLIVEMHKDAMRHSLTMILSRRNGPVVVLYNVQDVVEPLARYGFYDTERLLAWASGALIDSYDYVTDGRTRGRNIEMSFVDLHNLQKFLQEPI